MQFLLKFLFTVYAWQVFILESGHDLRHMLCRFRMLLFVIFSFMSVFVCVCACERRILVRKWVRSVWLIWPAVNACLRLEPLERDWRRAATSTSKTTAAGRHIHIIAYNNRGKKQTICWQLLYAVWEIKLIRIKAATRTKEINK